MKIIYKQNEGAWQAQAKRKIQQNWDQSATLAAMTTAANILQANPRFDLEPFLQHAEFRVFKDGAMQVKDQPYFLARYGRPTALDDLPQQFNEMIPLLKAAQRTIAMAGGAA